MTADQAYVDGFCKAAEAAGVEPAALMKAALDPATAGGAAAMAIGGALGGSALTGDDQSFTKRLGKGTAGTALGYLGYKAMTDPRWQEGIRSGTQKAMGIIRSAIGRLPAKAASARPCVKSAGPGTAEVLSRVIKRAEAIKRANAVKRAVAALGQASARPTVKQAAIPFMGAVAKGLKAVAGSRAGQAVAGAARGVANSRAGQAVGGAARRYGELMMGGSNPVRGAFRMGKADLSSMGNLRGWANTYGQGLTGKMGPEAAAELRKALAARAGTAATAGGAGLYALSGGNDDQQ